MKRLEHIRTLRDQTSRSQAKTPGGAVIVLAQIGLEKQRLQQEKRNWGTRIRKIEARLKEIDQMEGKLLAVANLVGPPGRAEPPAGVSGSLPAGFTEVTIRY
jgi:hypothetical protein